MPIIGAFFGLVAGGAFFVLNWAAGGFIAAVAALLLVHLLNRFLHIDGLSDLGDGLLSGGNQEKKVAAMKDSRSGAGGIAYVLFFELLSVAALYTLAGEDMGIWLFAPFAAEVLAKTALLTCAAAGKPAEGLAGIFVRNTPEGAVIPAMALSLLLVVPLGMLLAPTWGCCVFKTLTIVLSMLLVSILVGYLMAKLAKRNFGMVNGDVLGATNEIARPLVLITMIVVMTCLESVL